MERFEPHNIRFRLRAFHTEGERPRSHQTLRLLLDALTLHNVNYLRANPQTPRLYQSGVRYEEEPIGQEDWNDVATVLLLGWGDCEDLACWRAAELIVDGERLRQRAAVIAGNPMAAPQLKAAPIYQWRKLSPTVTLYHILCLVELNGQRFTEDPSKRLGMGSKPSQYTKLIQPMGPHAHAAAWPQWPAHVAA